MKAIRVGIIGLGVGEKHIEGCLSTPDCEIAALCDFSEQKLHEVSARYPGSMLTVDANKVIDDPGIDLVCIASYDNFHCEQILRAIAQGKHVFVEKPMCLSREEAQQIRLALAKQPQVYLSSNHILRKSQLFLQVKHMIESGELGTVYHLEGDYNYGRMEKITQGWRGTIDFYSVMYGGGIHMVDLLRWFAQSEVTEVSAVGNQIVTKGTGFRFNDCVVAILRFKNGAIGKVSANFGCVFPHFHRVAVYGTEATFLNDIGGGKLIVDRDANAAVRSLDAPYPGCRKGELLADFLHALQNSKEPTVSATEVFNTMSVCFAIEEAARSGATVSVRYL